MSPGSRRDGAAGEFDGGADEDSALDGGERRVGGWGRVSDEGGETFKGRRIVVVAKEGALEGGQGGKQGSAVTAGVTVAHGVLPGLLHGEQTRHGGKLRGGGDRSAAGG